MSLLLNCKGRLLVIDRPAVMGILNATPDSFYTRGRNSSTSALLEQAGLMLEQGADILDIGGMSTRPRAEVIETGAELDRVLPAIEAIRKHFPKAFISIDTYRAIVAEAAVKAGADIVNDISAGNLDTDMIGTVARLETPYILMHMQGTPADMQESPHYEDVVAEVLQFFIEKIALCRQAGIKDMILDPGFGFGKTQVHNYRLLKGLSALGITNLPVLTGLSRKSMVYRLLKTDAAQALNGTTALHMLALQQGAAILRAHDVKEAVECVTLYRYYQTI